MAIDMRELGVVRIATPCKANWKEMQGDDVKRFCAGCQKNVYHLSNLTAADARALLLKHEGKLCVRFYQRPDGSVLTQDCPTGVRRKRVRLMAAIGSAAAMVVSGAAFVLSAGGFGAASDRLQEMFGTTQGCSTKPLFDRDRMAPHEGEEIMGKMAAPQMPELKDPLTGHAPNTPEGTLR